MEVMGDVHDPYGLSIIVEVEDVAKQQRAAFDLLVEKGAMYDEGSGEDGGRRRKAEHRNGGDDRVVSSEVKRDAVRRRCSIGFGCVKLEIGPYVAALRNILPRRER